ncbi:HlyD family efflux transporter periplasmic adaptor subunit [Thalassotalea sp. G2M2-11]|uniref:efflux RND transporter periplasmic adaptor subunit n=1 Tax=Thalassotalea sp. G2M2-11 TaxID=2787627 RepID=UPI0019D2B0C3|nr:HlyD family efflux transporter periplasmic adaptor subunit [Thalassotalea sp. G2M2-11]
MDIKKSKQAFAIKKVIYLPLLLLVFAFIYLWISNNFSEIELNKKDLLIASVQKSNLPITVSGYGKLTSEKLQLITTKTEATVHEILLKPGATVEPHSIILRLVNPKLALALTNEQQQLAQLKANLRQIKVNNQREILTEKAKLTELNFQYESAKLTRVAEQKLATNGIISDITLKQSMLNEQQLKERISIINQQLSQLTKVHIEAINIVNERIKQQQGKLAILEQQLNNLEVKAGMFGVLQKLSVTLGESLQPGQALALIGSKEDLIAEIKIAQHDARLAQIGQTVFIDTHQDKMQGNIVRIEPTVTDNTVNIEVELPAELPKNVRPEQSVNAEILINTLTNATYITRPANAKAGTNITLYKLNETVDLAHRTNVKLGKSTGRYIEILSPVAKGEKFVITDLTHYQADEISLN